MLSRRAFVSTMIAPNASPHQIISAAIEPTPDAEYQRRLRLWATDCVAHTLHLLAADTIAHNSALLTIAAARAYANANIAPSTLSPPYARLYDEARRTNLAVASEIRIAAALCAHFNVFLGAFGAATHARRAIQNATYPPQPSTAELNWQVSRLHQWLQDDEPTPLSS